MGEITEESVGSEETIDGKDPATRLTSRRHGASSTHLNLFNAGQGPSKSKLESEKEWNEHLWMISK